MFFSQKRPRPRFPEKICVITAETGAALQDILNIIGRRYPVCSVVLIPVLVQGEKAPDSIASAFAKAGKTGADLIIFGRGGGSSEDLSAFNTEKVVRAVYESSIPTISAVGHETDVTLSDFAADLRAPTPSAAAELAVPDIREVSSLFDSYLDFIKRCAIILTVRKEKLLTAADNYIQRRNPYHQLQLREKQVLEKEMQIRDKLNKIIGNKEHILSEQAAVISALNPLAVLMRGYSIVSKDGKSVVSSGDIHSGDKIEIRVADGRFSAVVE